MLFLGSVAFGALIGCDSKIEGRLAVEKELVLKAEKRDCDSSRGNPCSMGASDSVRLTPKNYEADFNFKGPREVQLLVKQGSRTAVVPFTIPEGKDISVDQSRIFELLSAESNQPVDLKGNLEVRISDSPPVKTWESCPMRRYVQVCPVVPPGAAVTCYTREETWTGNRRVEYFIQYTNWNLEASFSEPGDPVVSAKYNGAKSDSRRIDLFTGPCF